jgi:FkbM family methyltransferase
MKLLSWMPTSLATWIYTVIFKPRFLRKLLQSLICCFIPEKVRVGGVMLALNNKDAVVSGSLFLGFYEKSNIEIFLKLIASDRAINFIDIGANIGMYSILAAKHSVAGSRVISIEPDDINCGFIRKSVAMNSCVNVTIFQQAAGDYDGDAKLYINELNKADHRLYDEKSERPFKQIKVCQIDTLLAAEGDGFRVDLVKIDTQGFELKVFKGMQKTLSSNPHIEIIIEFWPWGIAQAGDNPSELLDLILSHGFEIHKIDENKASFETVGAPETLLAMVKERQHVDLLLRRKRA